jgi:integrase/recombinase XerD
MTELRRSMLEDRQLRGLSERPPEMDVRAVRQLAPPFHQSPAQITEEELRQDCLHLKNVRQYARRASTMALGGSKFFFQHTLKRDWTTLTFVRPPREKTLPVILSLTEVQEIFRHVRLLRYRTCLTAISSCGLRLQEGTPLRVTAIDSSRMLMHGRHGQGGKDRYVPLPQRTLELRRQSWVTHRKPLLIVPAPGRGRVHAPTATTPRPKSSLQEACRAALTERGVNTLACVHTLRHSWATPLREAGVQLRLIQEALGHNSPTPTAV